MISNKHFNRGIILTLLFIAIGCSQPLAIGKYTQPISLPNKVHIDEVIFNNSANDELTLDEKIIEKKLLNHIKKNQNSFDKKTAKLTIELLVIKDKNIQNEKKINLHNIFAVLALFTTGVLPDTSSIDKDEFKQKLFILKITLAKEETKLFIEVDNYKSKEELREVFKKELFHKVEELLK